MNTQKSAVTDEGTLPRYRYELTDGQEVFSVHYLNADELFNACKQAREATDGNLFYRQNPPNFILIK